MTSRGKPRAGADASGDTAERTPGERALIDHIRSRLPAAPSSLLVGPGDDAAVVVPERGAYQALTTDAIVEGIHFDRRFSSLSDIGYKAVAVNVSDLAAMGAAPSFALLSLILPANLSMDDVDELLDGVLEAAALAKMTIAGGNISRSPGPLIVDVTAIGSVRPRRILTRSGGRPGDGLYVSGSIGGAAAGLSRLQAGGAVEHTDPMSTCDRRHRRPEPRLRLGLLLGRNQVASACMDLSDGLADAVRQVAEASGTGARIDAGLVPVDPAAAGWFRIQRQDAVVAAMTGGDDYELLFAVPARRRSRLRPVFSGVQGLPLTRIGELTADRSLRLMRRDGESEELPRGFTHFPG